MGFPSTSFFLGGAILASHAETEGEGGYVYVRLCVTPEKKPLPKNNDDSRVFFCRENLGRRRRVSLQQMGKSHRGKQMILLFLLLFFLGPSRLHFPDKTEVNEKRGEKEDMSLSQKIGREDALFPGKKKK